MGEIKSTLDLVMERTRHLSMSEEERARQKRADFEKRLQGVLQRYEDGGMSVESFLEKLEGLRSELKVEQAGILPEAVLSRIDPEKNNEGWLALLERVRPAACDPLRAALAEYREKKSGLRRKAEERLLERLVRDRGIDGSAVIPNPDKDAGFREAVSALGKKTHTAIEEISADTDQGK
jgi:hypothetical protein